MSEQLDLLTANLASMLAPAPSPKHTTSFTLQKHAYKHASAFNSVQESPAVADKPARRLRKVCTVYVRAVGL